MIKAAQSPVTAESGLTVHTMPISGGFAVWTEDVSALANGIRLMNEFSDDEGERTVVYGISREEWQNQKVLDETLK